MKSEQQIQNEILLAASNAGHRLFRANAGKIRTSNGAWVKLFPKGFPDTVGYRANDGKFIAIEVKNKKGKLSREQVKFAEFAKTQPILYGVARSKEDAIHIIENGLNGYGV